jgi:DNA replication and repair protein RecF
LRLKTINIKSFRSHKQLEFSPDTSINIIYGRNGSGKTNVLEAIHYTLLTKSLITASDQDVLRFDDPFFELSSSFISDGGFESKVRVYYSQLEGKHVFVNATELQTFSEIVGEYPCVSLTPYDISITQGSPQERRKFLDNSLSQSSKTYLNDLLSYRRTLLQRNKLLSDIKQSGQSLSQLSPFTELLASISARLIYNRLIFCRDFSQKLTQAFNQFQEFSEKPSLTYQSGLDLDDSDCVETIQASVEEKFRMLQQDEIRRGITLFGPHRDDLEFSINGLPLKKFASQGQHKTFLICLKIAQHLYLQEEKDEKPIFLLDDVFSELDYERSGELINLLKTFVGGQCFLTTTERKHFPDINQVELSQLSIKV